MVQSKKQLVLSTKSKTKKLPADNKLLFENTIYQLSPVPEKIQKRIPYYPTYKTYELKFTKPDDKRKFVTKLISANAGKMLYNARFFRCKYLDNKTTNLRKFYFKDIGKTFGEIIDVLKANGVHCYLHGGIIRDILIKVPSADIDLIFDKPVTVIKEICNKVGWPCTEVMEKAQYINFGVNKGDTLEGNQYKQAFESPLIFHESSINDFAYDINNGILIDITGFGMDDIVVRKFRLSARPDQWHLWASTDVKRPFRYFKMLQKGFNPINKTLHKFIINFITDNWTTKYLKPISNDYPVTWIKQIIIGTMTQGTIDPITGTYVLGPTSYKLLPYMTTLQNNLPEPIFTDILLLFNKTDIKYLKQHKIINSSWLDKHGISK